MLIIFFFFPINYVKDFFGLIFFLIFFSYFIFFLPNELGHPDNYIVANPIVTPAHIVPEWYFLPFYAILRSIPDKLFGVLALVFAILILFFLPFFGLRTYASPRLYIYYQFLFWFFLFNWFLLLWLGAQAVESPYTEVGQFSTCVYFFYFIFLGWLAELDFLLDRLWFFGISLF